MILLWGCGVRSSGHGGVGGLGLSAHAVLTGWHLPRRATWVEGWGHCCKCVCVCVQKVHNNNFAGTLCWVTSF